MVPASCSRCGGTHSVETFPSINTALDPELKARVRDGSLFVWECPYCGARNLLKYETLYHDPGERLMVWLLPGTALPPIQVADAVKDLEGYTLRLVREVGDLVEKVGIHAAGLDDVVVEMCKYVTRMELSDQHRNPAILDAPLKFYRMDGPDNDLVFSFPLDGEMKTVNVGFHVYEDARGILGRHPSVHPGPGFAQIDAAWLGRYFR
ncbi:MAG: CpXC domain-containing protein [Bacteroidales bacterium]|nr:CpXC domain-containing protein [Bacteroidales bacterium]